MGVGKDIDLLDALIEGLDLSRFYEFVDNRIALDLPPGKLIFQYTNWQSLFNGIIREKEDDAHKVHLFSTNCRFLNDPKEMVYGERYVDLALEGFFGKKSVFSDDSHLRSLYLTSFSLEENALPMWNTYGKSGDGLCIGFDPAILSTGDGHLGRCLYGTPLNHDSFMSTLSQDRKKRQINDGQKFTKYLGFLMDFCKNGCYHYEKEVRLVRSFMGDPDYRLSGNILVPYIDNVYPKEVIRKIIIGPCNDFERATDSLVRWLKRAGMEHVEVAWSKLPYRNN